MKRFNLLFDSWIPIKTRQGGNRPLIKAYEIVQKDIIGLDAPRADFNAALMQFLIGLLQTVLAPKNPKEWRTLFNQPPSEDELKGKFEEIKDAYYLNGDGYRFMQDPIATRTGEEPRPIEEMIFGAPSESGKEKNQDYFVKKSDIAGLCYPCAILALLVANILAEDGGRGYFQSMRGNGFVSCLVQLDDYQLEKSLWRDLWLNIIDANTTAIIDSRKNFYWIKDLPDKPYIEKLESITSDINDLKIEKKKTLSDGLKKEIDAKIKQLEIEIKRNKKEIDSLSDKKIVYPEKGSLQVYWAWMRRFFLDTSNTLKGQCSVCRKNDELVSHFYKTGKGYKYPKEIWQNAHPFSPSRKYQRDQYDKHTLKYKDKMLGIEMTQNGLPYTYWQDFFIQTENQTPAKVVHRHLKENYSGKQLIIWSFGYAMDSNSPMGWYESKTPLYLIYNKEQRQIFESEINKYIQASNKIGNSRGGYLTTAIKSAWFGESKEKNKDKKKAFNNDRGTEIAKNFWSNTENKFYELIKKLYDSSHKLTDEERFKLKRDWYRHIKDEATKLFNLWAFKSSIQTNPRRIAEAHNKLLINLNSKSLKQDILGLLKED